MNILPTLFNRRAARLPGQSGIRGLINRAVSAMSVHLHVKMANAWRDTLNPLRALTIQKAIGYLEAGERGEYADLQWLYRFIEMTDPTLVGLLARYDAGLVKLDYEFKMPADDELKKIPGASKQLAEEQAAALREAYDAVDNFRDALQAMVLARFRGHSMLEKHRTNDGDIIHLEPVPQWHWVRDGINGDWEYNKDARSGTKHGTPIDRPNFIIRECPRPVNRIALLAYCYRNLGIKDWAGFVETYGIPWIFIIGPPTGADSAKEAQYQEIAEQVTADARGYLPNGADVKTGDAGARGINPFKDFLNFLKEELVLAGTGGKLTMLAESGSGTLAGGAHQEAWDEICETEGIFISEVFQRDFDKPEVLEKKFPDRPHLAYMQLCIYNEDNPDKVAEHTQKFSAAGYSIDAGQLSEKTGYKITPKEQPATDAEAADSDKKKKLRNRDGSAIAKELSAALAGDAQVAIARLGHILEITDEQLQLEKLRAWLRDYPTLKADAAADPKLARVLNGLLWSEFASGLEETTP